ncbi:MAG: hypothetical protein Q4A10_05070 [Aerococcaceae bacterium]|nr:hypothetical protein [Aerococcaceae bacterium]
MGRRVSEFVQVMLDEFISIAMYFESGAEIAARTDLEHYEDWQSDEKSYQYVTGLQFSKDTSKRE